MANSILIQSGAAGFGPYPVNFTLGYLRREYVQLRVNHEADGLGDPIYRSISWVSDGAIQITSGTEPTSADTVTITRTVPKTVLIHDYQDGALIQEKNLDESNLQNIMAIQEFLDGRFPDDASVEYFQLILENIENGNIPAIGQDILGEDNIGIVADSIDDVEDVSASIEDVNLVAANLRGANTLGNVSNNMTAVTTVSTNMTAVQNTSTNMAAVIAAPTQAASASSSALLSQNWASKTDGIVAATDYSAKAWAIGGTGTETNNAKYWAEQAEAAADGGVVKVTTNDTAAGHLNTKLTVGSGLTKTVTSPGENEGLRIDLNLGSAAFANTGTGPTNVPLNSDLGGAAYKDVGTIVGDVVQLEDIGGGVAGLPAVDGSQLINLPVKTTFGAPIATTTGSAIEVTSIPSAVKRIIINFSNVGTNGSATPLLQLGDTGGYETSGYQGAVNVNGAAEVLSAGASFSRSGVHSSSAKYNGTLTLSLLDASTNTWSLSGDLARSDSGLLSTIACSKSLTDPLDKLRLQTTDAWNSGKINVIMDR